MSVRPSVRGKVEILRKYNSVQQYTSLYNSIQVCTTVYKTVQQCTNLYNSVQQCTMLYNAVQQRSTAYKPVQQRTLQSCTTACKLGLYPVNWGSYITTLLHIYFTFLLSIGKIFCGFLLQLLWTLVYNKPVIVQYS